MKFLLQCLWYTGLLLFLFSCEYELPEVYQKDLNKNVSPPEIQTVNLDLNEDTLVLYYSKRINFHFESKDEKQKILFVNFFLDNNFLESKGLNNSSIYLPYNNLSIGTHKLIIEILTKSGTGSIADNLDLEGFVITSNKEWVIKVVKNAYTKAIQTSKSNDDNLELSWPNYPYSDFKQYAIKCNDKIIGTTSNNEFIDKLYNGEAVKYFVNVITQTGETVLWANCNKSQEYGSAKTFIYNGFLKLSWPKIIGPPALYQVYREGVLISSTYDLECIDSSYVGENAGYIIKVKTKNGLTNYWVQYFSHEEKPKLSLFVTNTNQYIIKWENKFYNALEKAKLYQSIGHNWIVVKESLDCYDTTYTINNANFCDILGFQINLVPKKKRFYSPTNSYFQTNSYYTTLGYRYRRDQYYNLNTLRQISKNEFIYLNDNDSLFKYSVTNRQILQNFSYKDKYGHSPSSIDNLTVSNSGKYITATNSSDNILMLINSENFQYSIEKDIYSLTPISDIGTGILSTYNDGFYIYDFNTSSKIAHYKKGSFGGQGQKISINGDYLFVVMNDSLRLFNFNGTDIKNIWLQKYYYYNRFLFEFDPLNSNRLFLWNGSTFSIRQCSNFIADYQYPLNDMMLLNIDYYNNEMLTFNNNYLYVRNLIDGAILKEIPYNRDTYLNQNEFILINHNIISKHGFIYFVN